jgi:hypothetical protein
MMMRSVSWSPVDGPLPDPAFRHDHTMMRLHETLRVNVATGAIGRGIRVKRDAALPYRSFERDNIGGMSRAKDGRAAIEALWQRHTAKLEHFDDADRLPRRQWGRTNRENEWNAEHRRGDEYRLVGVNGDTTLGHDCNNHLPTSADGGAHWDPQAFVIPNTGLRRIA